MKNKGITLISLIVTIIIMIILAGVTVNLITEGGIIDKTREATGAYSAAAEKEELELAIFSEMNYLEEELELEDLNNALKSIGWDEITGESPWTCQSPNETKFKVTSVGEVTLVNLNEEDEESLAKLVFEEGKTVPDGYFYGINWEEVEQEEDYVYTCDCYATSEEEIANNQMTKYCYEIIFNYKNSIMPSADTFENDGEVYCMDLGISFHFSTEKTGTSEEESGLCMSGDENVLTDSSIEAINTILNDGISIYGYDKIKEIYFNYCNALIDASKLDLTNVTNLKETFYYCENLEKAPTIPVTIEYISNCFEGCTSLTNITFEGTINEFKNIDGYELCGDEGLIVHCSDGDYTVGE